MDFDQQSARRDDEKQSDPLNLDRLEDPWRKRLFAVLHQNSTPIARSYNIPPDRVFEVGAYVEI